MKETTLILRYPNNMILCIILLTTKPNKEFQGTPRIYNLVLEIIHKGPREFDTEIARFQEKW